MAMHIRQLKKQFVSPDGAAVPVIDIDEFAMDDREQVALIGGSGTGKTTLLHLIAGILAPDSGQILFSFGDDSAPRTPAPAGGSRTARAIGGGTFSELEGGALPAVPPSSDGLEAPAVSGELDAAPAATGVLPYRGLAPQGPGVIDITRLSEARRDVFRGRNIGYIFQTHHLLQGFTAMENVILGMSFTGRPTDPAWAKHLLEEVGLGHRLDYKPAKLSVGQQQRVAVARALANRPKLVLGDEPTGALDPRTAQQVLVLIRKLCDEVGAGLLLVSHDPAISSQLPRGVSLAELNKASV